MSDSFRDALVALEKDFENCYDMGGSVVWRSAADKIAAILAAHPAVEGDAVERAMDASADYWNLPELSATCDLCRGTGLVPDGDGQEYCGDCGGIGDVHTGTEEGAMRAALDAAWPGMVANDARYRWLRESSNLTAGIGGGIGFACGNWTKDEGDKQKLDASIDAAMEASRG